MIDLSPLKSTLNGKPIAIVGLGKSGMATVEACQQAGIDTVVWDDNPDKRRAAERIGATVKDLTKEDFKQFSLLCLAPGIPLTHPEPHFSVTKAKAAGIDIVCDIELLYRAHPSIKSIGITGTNGKSTTTALIGHILKTAGQEYAVGGNIGEAALTLPDLSGNGLYVFEMSSYQIDLCPTFRPTIAVLINISPDHLDRHGSMEGYVAAKAQLFEGTGIGIVGMEDDWSRGIYGDVANSNRKDIPVCISEHLIEGICVSADGILKNNCRDICSLNGLTTLKGKHNWQNAAMAYTVCHAAGVQDEDIIKGLATFPGLAHRQKIVTTLNGVTYINDSKATNDDAAATALGTYDPIYWIAGGLAKEGGFSACEKHLSHIRHAFLIGKDAQKLADWLDTNKIPYTHCGALENAVMQAHNMAQEEKLKNATVLLSPACASWDQFDSFEQRGDSFTELVTAITQMEKMQEATS